MLISTSVLEKVSNYDLVKCISHMVMLHSGPGRTARYTRDDLRTMLLRVVVPSSLTTSTVPNKAHRRLRRFQAFMLYTSFSCLLTFILYVCYHRIREYQGLGQHLQTSYIALDRKGELRSGSALAQGIGYRLPKSVGGL